MTSRLRALRVLHPFPSFLNSALVLALAYVAGATPAVALLLATGMLGIQFCIGTVNDLVDVRLDAGTKPWKPIPSGILSVAVVRSIAVLSASVALATSATQGLFVLALALVMLGCGLLYDVRLKPTRWAWACFSVAFAILPIYAWFGAVREFPPLAEFLVPLAALAGPALQLSNGIVDLEHDEAGGIRTLATRLGRRTALLVIAVLLVSIYGLAWATLTIASGGVNVGVAAATILGVVGLALQTRESAAARQAGWSLQAVGIALLGLGWLSAVA
jgi:4-hydroxybenzoate polyprenyltransferase